MVWRTGCTKLLRDCYKVKTEEPIAAVTPEEEENYHLLVHCRCEGATDIFKKRKGYYSSTPYPCATTTNQFDRKIFDGKWYEILGVFHNFERHFANLFIFHHISLYSSWYTQKEELIQTDAKHTLFPHCEFTLLRVAHKSWLVCRYICERNGTRTVSLRDTDAHYVLKPTVKTKA